MSLSERTSSDEWAAGARSIGNDVGAAASSGERTGELSPERRSVGPLPGSRFGDFRICRRSAVTAAAGEAAAGAAAGPATATATWSAAVSLVVPPTSPSRSSQVFSSSESLLSVVSTVWMNFLTRPSRGGLVVVVVVGWRW